MHESPLITVYMPTHNRSWQVEKAARSVLKQSYQNIELIIVDDGSTDDTSNILQQLTKVDSRVKIFKNKNSRGACFSRNLAIKKAKGKFITGLDDDDEFLPGRLQAFIDAYDAEFSFLCAGFLWDDGRKTKKVNMHAKIFGLSALLDYNEASNQVFVETYRLRDISGFDENFSACQDYDTWTRLMKKYGDAKRIANSTYKVSAVGSRDRITEPSNWLKGHQQFMEKHLNKMTKSNICNQEFKVLMVKKQRMTVGYFLLSLRHGLIRKKIKYFVASHLIVVFGLSR